MGWGILMMSPQTEASSCPLARGRRGPVCSPQSPWGPGLPGAGRSLSVCLLPYSQVPLLTNQTLQSSLAWQRLCLSAAPLLPSLALGCSLALPAL